MSPEIALITCTYNPEKEIFLRVLNSVIALEEFSQFPVEYVIIDNNSFAPVASLDYVQDIIAEREWIKIITENRQGLAYARIKGIKSTSAEIVVFVDDDNEISSTYIESLLQLFEKYPTVAAWGPGNIHAEFLGEVSEWFVSKFKTTFQERHIDEVQYACIPGIWIDSYPFGTGLSIRRKVLEHYCAVVEKNILLAVGRQGNTLSSGEDNQIVWETIKMGYAAGVAPQLQVTHIVSPKKSNLSYIKRLVFGVGRSYMPALVEAFPQMKEQARQSIPSHFLMLKIISKIIFTCILTSEYRLLAINIAGYIGGVLGTLKAANSNKYQWINLLTRWLALT